VKPARKKLLSVILWLFSVVACAVILDVIVVVALVYGGGGNRQVAEWTQPANIKYDSTVPYRLAVVETMPEKMFTRPKHFIYVGRDTGSPGYGHYCDFSFYNYESGDIDSCIRQSKVEWSKDGVTLESTSGHKLFIPKKSFIGGR
jgi:hypothetical protein